VLVILPNQDAQAAVKLLRLACTKLMNERLEQAGTTSWLSIAAGVISTCDSSVSPADLRSAADKVQYRAKEQSKRATPRPSVIAIEGQADLFIIEHDPGAT
jgi:hypothetical protein